MVVPDLFCVKSGRSDIETALQRDLGYAVDRESAMPSAVFQQPGPGGRGQAPCHSTPEKMAARRHMKVARL